MNPPFKDSNARSLVKGITWRVVGTIDTFIIAYFITGSFKLAGPIAVLEVFSKILLYFLHERLWNIVKWGRRSDGISHLRSVIKGLSWRFCGSMDTMIISWIISGNPLSAFEIGIVEVITKITLYYIHERIWTSVKWGRIYLNTAVESVHIN